ncbi:MAG TPA: PA14 domain-containing protein [Sedimentisphaerales bacterium]|nr:PA14 domain-containing protein [Sedimentisphaerales bacterium]
MYRKCVCVTALCLTLALAGSVGAQLGQGKVLFEYWFDISGTSVDGNLRTNPNFPNNPNESEWRDELMSRVDWRDNYGLRARAYLTPPQTGEYTFWIAGDDNCQLWLSTDADAANAVKIAEVTGWTGARAWTGSPGSTNAALLKSVPIALQQGQKYYIEALMKEGGGGDSMGVAWAGPGIGEAPTVIAGQYCTAFIRSPEPLLMASKPKPADKAVDVLSATFEWTPGLTAVAHEIYFGTTPELTAADQKPALPGVAMYYHFDPLEPGKTYYWRVDEIDAAGNKYPGFTWSFTVMPLEAHAPTPADGGKDVPVKPTLKWVAGQNAIGHVLYLGKDKAAVTAGDVATKAGILSDVTFTPEVALDAFSTYYWRVDEIDMAGGTVPGPVWSFSTVAYASILEGQTTLTYNNRVAPYITSTAMPTPADLTAGGKLTDLAIRFQGRAAPTGGITYDDATGTYSLTGAGADIWNNADEFHYAYKTLNGDGTMVARVVTVGTGTSEWAKGGVMIRQSLNADSTHAFMPITGPSTTTAAGGNGASFQRRLTTAGASSNDDSPTRVNAPYWVKIERKGDSFSGYISPDGVEWTQLGSAVTIAMGNPVYIGLAVTSHVAGTLRTFTFDNVATTGDVTPAGLFTTWDDIGIASNDPAVMSVALEDAAGKVAVVAHPDPKATQTTVMDLVRVPLAAFAGVDVTNAVKLTLSVGDGQPGGTGVMTFGDIRTVQPAVSPAAGATDITAAGDAVIGFPEYAGSWPAAEHPALAIDNQITTKYLNFGGASRPSGIIVTPAVGPTVVTGLSLTTANDAVERDPVAFELYGSNQGVEGPWALIAKGAIDDFSRPIAWPRRWKNVTPIGFANAIPYTTYKVVFTAVRGPNANSMQIAEIELLGTVAENEGPVIFWVTFHPADNAPTAAAVTGGFTTAPDKGYTDLLKEAGYNVVRYVQTGTPNVDLIKASADLVIISRSVASSSFQNAAATTWNTIPVPMISMNGYINRKSRMGFNTGSTIPDSTGDLKLAVLDPAHPIFAGISLTDGMTTNPYAGMVLYPDGVAARGISIVTEPPVDGAITLATVPAGSTTGPAGAMIIAEYPAGTAVIHDGGAGTDILPAPRLVFLSGAREAASGKDAQTAGQYDLYEDGAVMFLNAVAYMLQ